MYEKSVLPNGLRVLTAAMPHTRSVTIILFIGAGSRYETDTQAGMSHLLEHMCFKGTQRRPTPMAISETIERVGGVMNASTDRELTTYWCRVARQHLPLAADLLADMVCHSLMTAEELEKERPVVVEELAMTDDVPVMRAENLIDEVLWPDQPLGRDVGGTKESVQSIQRDPLLEYWRHQYAPHNAVAVVAGDVQHEEVVRLLEQCLGEWEPRSTSPWFPAQDGQTGPRLKLERRRSDQTHICIGFKGLSSTHPDRYKLDLLNAVLGEGMSSRLFLELRERQGLAYDVHSSVSHLLDCGSMIVYAGVTPSKMEQAVKGILAELARIKEGMTEDDLEKSQEFSKGRLLLRMEDTRSVAGWVGAQELLLGRVLSVDDVMQHIDAVTPEDIQEVAQRLLVRDKLNLAMVGPFRGDRTERRLEALLDL